MISAKKLINMARKWQKFAATQRKRISFHRNNENYANIVDSCSSSSQAADKGHFVVYTADQRRFKIPLNCLNNEIFRQLLKMSEEFGLPSDGPIILPIHGQLMDYIITVIQHGVAGDVQKALLISVATSRCSFSTLHQEFVNEQLLVY